MPTRHALEYAGFRLARAVLAVLPEGLAVRLGALAGLFAGSVLRIRRRDVDRHLALAFPEATRSWRRRVARASYAHLGRESVMLFRIADWPAERLLERVTFEGIDELGASAQPGSGALLLTGHIGNWELAGAALGARGVGLDAIAKGMSNRRFQEELFRTRERLGLRLIESARAPKEVLRSLRDGRVVAILGDQNAVEGGVFVPFFGKDAATARGPALFALRTGAPVFAGVALRRPGWRQRYHIEVRRLDITPTGEVEADVRALLAAYAEVLESAVRSAPEQYFWQHKRWKTRPPVGGRTTREAL